MKEKTKTTIKIIGVGIIIVVLSVIAFSYNLIAPLDPNPFYSGGEI